MPLGSFAYVARNLAVIDYSCLHYRVTSWRQGKGAMADALNSAGQGEGSDMTGFMDQ
jgi:hypothetical protein